MKFLEGHQIVDYSFLVNASTAKGLATARGCGIIDFFTAWTMQRDALIGCRKIAQGASKIDVIPAKKYAARMLKMFGLVVAHQTEWEGRVWEAPFVFS